MGNEISVLLDINIILDVLQKREPFYQSSAGILAAIETGKLVGYISAHSVTTLFYLVKKDRGVSEARSMITNLLQILRVCPVDQNTIEQALNLDYADFEDSVQMMAAVQGKLSCIITRKTKDFEPALLPVMQPVDFLASL